LDEIKSEDKLLNYRIISKFNNLYFDKYETNLNNSDGQLAYLIAFITFYLCDGEWNQGLEEKLNKAKEDLKYIIKNIGYIDYDQNIDSMSILEILIKYKIS